MTIRTLSGTTATDYVRLGRDCGLQMTNEFLRKITGQYRAAADAFRHLT